MRHAFANRMLFGLVVLVVVSLPFVFHWGVGGSDTGSSGDEAASVAAAAIVGPYVQSANDQAFAEGRPTTLADVQAALPPASSTGSPDPAASGVQLGVPVFTVAPDRITAQVTALGSPVTCVITISAGKAVDRC